MSTYTPGIGIASSTNATPIVVTTSVAHGLASGDSVYIASHAVNTNANGFWTITVTGANTFSLTSSIGNGVGVATGSIIGVLSGGTALPADGDAVAAASVDVPIARILDELAYLKARAATSIRTQLFTTTGTFYTGNATHVRLFGVGAGGGGGAAGILSGSAGGGGGGGVGGTYAERYLTVPVATAYDVTIGVAGAGGAVAQAAGAAGTATYWGNNSPSVVPIGKQKFAGGAGGAGGVNGAGSAGTSGAVVFPGGEIGVFPGGGSSPDGGLGGNSGWINGASGDAGTAGNGGNGGNASGQGAGGGGGRGGSSGVLFGAGGNGAGGALLVMAWS